MKRYSFKSAVALSVALAFFGALVWVWEAGAKGAIRDEGIRASSPQAAYAGTASCAPCHGEKYDHWTTTVMSSFVRLRSEAAPLPGDWSSAPVDSDAVGVVVGGRRKIAYVDSSWKVLPYEYRIDEGAWRARRTWRGRDYRERCGTCHLTGMNLLTLEFRELGVGCESCHGPGAMHVRNESGEDIAVPSAPTLCRRCHNERNNHGDALTGWTAPFHR